MISVTLVIAALAAVSPAFAAPIVIPPGSDIKPDVHLPPGIKVGRADEMNVYHHLGNIPRADEFNVEGTKQRVPLSHPIAPPITGRFVANSPPILGDTIEKPSATVHGGASRPTDDISHPVDARFIANSPPILGDTVEQPSSTKPADSTRPTNDTPNSPPILPRVHRLDPRPNTDVVGPPVSQLAPGEVTANVRRARPEDLAPRPQTSGTPGNNPQFGPSLDQLAPGEVTANV